MSTVIKKSARDPSLFDRVVSILEKARATVARSVNSQMVIAYWLIGREIVEEEQKGQARAEYGRRLIAELAKRLTQRYGKGFSETNLKYFRSFYLAYANRLPEIGHPVGDESVGDKKGRPTGDESPQGFHPDLSWSHYRALMWVENAKARSFYEIEAACNGWNKRELERQIQSLFYERLLKSRDKAGMLQLAKDGQSVQSAIDVVKDPYVLEFLDLPGSHQLNESDIENALITNLQAFLLELGKGFSFVARQKRLRFDDEDFYIDLVFYNYLLKCFVLIDLKVGKLTHQDIGQMDGYIRMYEDKYKVERDNPTIGLILCSEKNEAVARYSVLNEDKRLFASKYKLVLPNEKQLRLELERERRLLEERIAADGEGNR
jgi:predicted nuclease of restriction endonuclease-like (RecB) superfamily